MRAFIDSLLAEKKLADQVRYRGLAPARPAVWHDDAAVALDPALAEAVARGAKALGVERLYSHQGAAFEHARAGRNVLLATPTASGKTLAYLLAFLAHRAVDPQARALFVYPLKALARDQLATIRRFLKPLGLAAAAAAEVYDGDTPEAARRRIRRSPPAIVVTNPDMLHLGIVPSHETWGGFLEHLALVAVDEAHSYRGLFGAHVHHVLRRLLRAAALHGGTPRFVAGSATIGAPQEFIETLGGVPFEVVEDSGAPVAARHVLFLAPHAISPYTIAVQVLARAVAAGHKTIAFTKARRVTELMQQWLRQAHPEIAARVASYRSGYLPEERREIEARLFGGELDGVISTSALEAGIDVGGLDVCVLVGYPGSLATAWQRIGRAGRSDRESLAVLVALPDALDQYVVAHPEHFFSGRFERAVLDPANDVIADRHLVCAGAERSLDPPAARFLHGDGWSQRVERLVARRELMVAADDDARWFALRHQPQREFSLRSSGSTWELRRASDGRALGTIDDARLWHEAHPGAIYLHAGQAYLVQRLDPETRVVALEPSSADWFTQVYARKETEILERFAERPLGPARLAWGRVKVTTFIEGYARRRLHTQEEIARYPLDAPPQELETIAFWLELPEALLPVLVDGEFHPAGSLHALEHAAIGLFPLLAICDRWDLGGISYAHHPRLERPAIFVYDGWPGGAGLARTGFERAEELLERTRALIAGCTCEDGCPACIHSPKCGSGNHPLDKAGALAVLAHLVEAVPLPQARATAAEVAARLASHRSHVHGGVRGGRALEPGFFAPGALPASLPAAAATTISAASTAAPTAASASNVAPRRAASPPAPSPATPPRLHPPRLAAPTAAGPSGLVARAPRPPVVEPPPGFALPPLAGERATLRQQVEQEFQQQVQQVLRRPQRGPVVERPPVALDPAQWPSGLPLPSEVLRPGEGAWLFFDTETLRGADEVGGWGNIARMGLALAVAFDPHAAVFRTYLEADTARLVADLEAADIVVGYNSLRFDATVLEGQLGRPLPRLRQRSLDLLDVIHRALDGRFRVSLGHLAEQTLGIAKSGDGLQSLAWVREGRLDLVEPYCRQDVLITAALWVYGRVHGHVVFADRKTGERGRIPVVW